MKSEDRKQKKVESQISATIRQTERLLQLHEKRGAGRALTKRDRDFLNRQGAIADK